MQLPVPVFVSSTFEDLRPERHAIERALNRLLEAKFIGMEFFGSRDEVPRTVALEAVGQSRLYIGIIAGRYGSGITEDEYLRAKEIGLECLFFLKRDEAIPAEFREADAEKNDKLKAFRKQALQHTVSFFSTSDELGQMVLREFYRWLYRQTAKKELESQSTRIVSSEDADTTFSIQSGSYGNVIDRYEGAMPQYRPVKVAPALRPFPRLVDRTIESSRAVSAIEKGIPVELFGPHGIGKTSILRRLAYSPPAARIEDGVAYLEVTEALALEDLLQSLFDLLFETNLDSKPRDSQVRRMLQTRRTLVLLDDLESTSKLSGRLLQALPNCVFVFTAIQRHNSLDETVAIEIPGLPIEDGLTLLERGLERSLTEEERDAARAICAELAGNALRLLQTGRKLRSTKLSLAALSSESPLSEVEYKVLAALSAADGRQLQSETLSEALESMPTLHLTEVLARLESLRLIEELEGAYRERAGNLVAVNEKRDDYRVRILNCWLKRGAVDVKECDAALHLLQWAANSGRTREASGLAVLVSRSLAANKRWGAWGTSLDLGLAASRASNDREREAWTLHEKGTRAALIGNDDEARALLEQALQARFDVGDHIGASVTRHNLDTILHLLPVAATKPHARRPPEVRPGSRRWIAYVGGAALLAVAVSIALPKLRSRVPSAPPSKSSVMTPQASASTTPAVLPTAQSTGRAEQPAHLPTAQPGLVPTLQPTPPSPPPTATPAVKSTSPSAVTPSPRPSPARTPGEVRTPDAMRPVIVVSSGRIDFGRQQVGNESEARDVVVENTGNGPLDITEISVSGSGQNDFKVDQSCLRTAIRPQGGKCRITSRFVPRYEGWRAARVEIHHNAGRSPTTIGLIGEGVRRAVVRDPTPTPATRPTPTPDLGYCCLSGKLSVASRKECAARNGRFFVNSSEAREKCNSYRVDPGTRLPVDPRPSEIERKPVRPTPSPTRRPTPTATPKRVKTV
jgi:Domain of unknown function (DUF4062)/NB-ARC domain